MAFGGPGGHDLYVTSARTGDPAVLEETAGAIFRVKELKSFLDGKICQGQKANNFNYEGDRKFSTC